MITEFLTNKKSKEVYEAIIDRMVELETNIPNDWKPEWAKIRYDAGATQIVQVDDIDERYDEVISYSYSFVQLYNMIPKNIKIPHRANFIMVIDCQTDRVKYNWEDDPGITIRDFHTGNLTENLADAFIWWVKSNYFKPMFLKEYIGYKY